MHHPNHHSRGEIMTPLQRLQSAVQTAGAPLSVGLEPRPGSPLFPDDTPLSADSILSFCRTIIDSTQSLAAAYKPNLAFFEALGPAGWSALEQVHKHIPAHAILLADAKRGDIGSTAAAYATAILDRIKAHAVTINPLMGFDCVEPFLNHPSKPLVYLLALTSNPGAADFLATDSAAEPTLAIRIATKAAEWDSTSSSIGLVVGATRADKDLRAIHAAAPNLPWLVPGIGAQGGSLEAVSTARGNAVTPAHILVHATRSLMPAAGESSSAIRANAAEFHAQLKQQFDTAVKQTS